MNQIRAPQSGVTKKDPNTTQRNQVYRAEFEGVVKSPAQKLLDAGKIIVAEYKQYEEKTAKVILPIWMIALGIAISMFVGAAFYAINH